MRSVTHRGGTGDGRGYLEAANLGPGGACDLNDLLGAITIWETDRTSTPTDDAHDRACYSSEMLSLDGADAHLHRQLHSPSASSPSQVPSLRV